MTEVRHGKIRRSQIIEVNRGAESVTEFVEQALTLLVWLVLVLELFMPWENFINPAQDAFGQSNAIGVYTITRVVDRIAYVVIVLLCVCRWRQVTGAVSNVWWFILLCGWIALSTLSLPDPTKSGMGEFFILFAFSAYVACRYTPKQSVALLTKGFAVAALSCFAVMALAPNLGLSNLGGSYANAWRGAFVHKNWLGRDMSVGVLVCAYSYISKANSRSFAGLTLLASLFLLFMSHSATAYVSTLVTGLVAFLGAAVQSSRVPVLRFMSLAVIAVTVLILTLLPLGLVDVSIHQLSGLFGRSADLTGRTALWQLVYEAIKARPLLGYGYGFWDQPSITRENIWLSMNWHAGHAHNNWLDTALQLGFVGAAITASIWLIALRRAVWLVLSRYNRSSLFLLCLLVNSLSSGLAETVTIAPVLTVLFWWVTAYIYIARLSQDQRHERRSALDDSLAWKAAKSYS